MQTHYQELSKDKDEFDEQMFRILPRLFIEGINFVAVKLILPLSIQSAQHEVFNSKFC